MAEKEGTKRKVEAEDSVEALEEQAFQRLSAKKPCSTVMKRPSAKAKAAVAKPKPQPKPQPKAKTVHAGQKKGDTEKNLRGNKEALGCPRCRGNWRGCETCANPLYQGIRLPGRCAWKSYMEKKKGSNKKK